MQRRMFMYGGLLLVLIGAFAAGCRKSASSSAKVPKAKEGAQVNVDSNGNERGKSEATNNAEITAALANLPASDRALAEGQKTCPVSGELLGSMGAPIKIDVKGQSVFICCEGCRDQLLAKPDEYLAKIKR